MNKQLTKKLIGIAASAALVGSVALSGTAIAGPGGGNGGGKGKGPQASLGVTTVCFINEATDELDIYLTITDKSSGSATAELGSVTIQGEYKSTGPVWSDIPNSQIVDGDSTDPANNPTQIGLGQTMVSIPLCDMPMSAKAVNALTSVTLNGAASKDEYTSRCKDDPDTPYVNEANLKVADYPMLCN
jgi:hypothetical protein